MRTPLIAILLSVLAVVATAHDNTARAPAPVKHHTASASARPAPELINAAHAATNGTSVGRQAEHRPRPQVEGEPHGNVKAMLLAALALMAGIALRRFSRRQ